MPFSREEFFAIFTAWNTAAWPYWLLAYPVGLIMLFLCLRGTGRAPRIVLALLGVMWIFCGAGYHWAYFAQINPAARGFDLVLLTTKSRWISSSFLEVCLKATATAGGPVDLNQLTLQGYSSIKGAAKNLAARHKNKDQFEDLPKKY